MSSPVAYLNGDFMPAAEAKLNIFDYGLLMGVTFTEMTRTFSHQLFRAQDHVERLFRSLHYAGIELVQTPAEILDLTHQVAGHNTGLLEKGQDLAVVQFVTPGENPIYGGLAAHGAPARPTVCIHSFPLPFSNWRHAMEEGAHLVTPSTRHLPPQCVDAKTKNRSRLHWWLAEREARQVDARAMALLLDLDGNITECASSNILLLKEGTVFSPRSRNILQGVTMGVVRELCTELGYGWVEKDLQVYDAVNAQEAWLTTTSFCLAPCTRINAQAIGDGKIGPAYENLLAAWNKMVGVDIRAQILESTY